MTDTTITADDITLKNAASIRMAFAGSRIDWSRFDAGAISRIGYLASLDDEAVSGMEFLRGRADIARKAQAALIRRCS